MEKYNTLFIKALMISFKKIDVFNFLSIAIYNFTVLTYYAIGNIIVKMYVDQMTMYVLNGIFLLLIASLSILEVMS